jgi:hypothetical protein
LALDEETEQGDSAVLLSVRYDSGAQQLEQQHAGHPDQCPTARTIATISAATSFQLSSPLIIEYRLDAIGRLANGSERFSKLILCGAPALLCVAMTDNLEPEPKAWNRRDSRIVTSERSSPTVFMYLAIAHEYLFPVCSLTRYILPKLFSTRASETWPMATLSESFYYRSDYLVVNNGAA